MVIYMCVQVLISKYKACFTVYRLPSIRTTWTTCQSSTVLPTTEISDSRALTTDWHTQSDLPWAPFTRYCRFHAWLLTKCCSIIASIFSFLLCYHRSLQIFPDNLLLPFLYICINYIAIIRDFFAINKWKLLINGEKS